MQRIAGGFPSITQRLTLRIKESFIGFAIQSSVENNRGCCKISHPSFFLSSVRLFTNILSDIDGLCPLRADCVYVNRPNTG